MNDYQEKKQFMVILQELFSKIDDLASDDKINSNEYLEIATLCKDLQNAKQLIIETIVFKTIDRTVKRKPLTPPIKEVDKLIDKTYHNCPHCDKRIKNSYLKEHINSSITCQRQRQTKRNIYNVKQIYNTKYGIFQALNLTLKHKHIDFSKLSLTKKQLTALNIEKKDDMLL